MTSARSGVSGLLVVAAALLAFPLLLSGSAGAAARPQEPASPSLIYGGWYGNTMPTPSYIVSNLEFLESRPFQGMVVYLRNPPETINASKGVMSNTPVSYADISKVLAPFKGLEFTNLKSNFGYVVGTTPPDFFDSWSVPIQNFANLAKAAKEAGLKGIFLDNEQYFNKWAAYPGAHPSKTLAQYQAQARLRGKQVMEAMVAEYPEIEVVSLHGPYISQPDAPWQYGFIIAVNVNLLMGPFFAGFHEGRGPFTKNIDGGEFYGLRSFEEFSGNRQYRRVDFASNEVNCAYLTPSLKSTWTSSISLSFGVYDLPIGNRPMTPDILQQTLRYALDHSDNYTWFYTEGDSFLMPESEGGASEEWVDAVRSVFTSPPTGGGGGGSSGGGSGASGSSDPSGSSNCGLLGIEFLPLLAVVTVRRLRSPRARRPAIAGPREAL